MFSWLAVKRVELRIKEFASIIVNYTKSSSQLDIACMSCAKIKFLTIINGINAYSVLDSPGSYPPEKVISVFEYLEEEYRIIFERKRAILSNRIGFGNSNRGALAFQSLVRDAEYSEHALALWMATAGCGIVPGITKNVTEVWETVLSVAHMWSDASINLRELESNTRIFAKYRGMAFEPFYEAICDSELKDCAYVVPIFCQ